MKIQMHEEEIALLSNFLRVTENYFEYGVGGSTCLAADLVKKSIYGIDSDAKWIAQVMETVGKSRNVHLTHVDIGKTGGWGTPHNRDSEHKFPTYSQAIAKTGRDFDFCLVDGRFRVACFLQALHYLPRGAVVAIHDYTVRPEYHLVEKYARPIARKHQLSIFVRRADCDMGDLLRDLDQHRLNWA